ncbi:thioredoxin family protein [bacterium]|nr:thioredoxin family protein [bacterium]
MLFRLCKKVLLLALLLSVFYSLSASGGKLPFFPGSFSQLQQQAEINRTPYFIYFYLTECEGCTKMSKETFNNEGLVQFVSQNYMAYKVDGLDFINGIDIATKYGVAKFPTVILLGPDGNIRNRSSGYLSYTVMLTMLRNGIKESDNAVSSGSVSRSAAPSTMRTAEATQTNRNNTRAGSAPNSSFNTSQWAENSAKPSSSSFYQPETSILRTKKETNLPATTQRKPASLSENDRKEYIKTYMENRMNVSPQNKGYSSTGYYNNQQNTPSSSRPVSSGTSYVDDYSRATLKEATQNGYYPSSYYTAPPKWGSNGTGYSNSASNTADKYGNISYIDDRTRANPELATRKQDQNPSGNQYRSESPYRGEPSFLDNIDGTPQARWTQNEQYRSGDVFLKGEADYAIDKDGQWVALYDLDPNTLLIKDNGEFYIETGSPQSEQFSSSAGQRTAGQDWQNNGTSRGSDTGTKAVSPAVRKINPSVPGLIDYSPEDIDENTFGIIIGDFVSINKLKHALEEFEDNNEEAIWVYGEKVNNRHHYKLVMGEYRGEQEAVSTAIKMGASWENIEVVNLAKLK